VLDGNPALPFPLFVFRIDPICLLWPPTVAHLSYCWALCFSLSHLP